MTLRLSIVILGTLVLISYVIGFARVDDVMSFWGGLRENGWKFVIPFMLLATVGFILFWWTALFTISVEDMQQLRWPCGVSDGQGGLRLLMSMVVFLVPSIFWLEATIFHINYRFSWSPALPIGILVLVAIGNIMFGLLAFAAFQDSLPGGKRMLIGAILVGIQCIINDAIIWNALFPW